MLVEKLPPNHLSTSHLQLHKISLVTAIATWNVMLERKTQGTGTSFNTVLLMEIKSLFLSVTPCTSIKHPGESLVGCRAQYDQIFSGFCSRMRIRPFGVTVLQEVCWRVFQNQLTILCWILSSVSSNPTSTACLLTLTYRIITEPSTNTRQLLHLSHTPLGKKQAHLIYIIENIYHLGHVFTTRYSLWICCYFDSQSLLSICILIASSFLCSCA